MLEHFSCNQSGFTTIAFYIFGIQILHGVAKSELRNSPTNFIFIWFLIFTFFLTSNYVANIKASFLATESSHRVESLEEAMANKNMNMQVIVGIKTNLETLTTNNSSSIYIEVAKRLKTYQKKYRHAKRLLWSSLIDIMAT